MSKYKFFIILLAAILLFEQNSFAQETETGDDQTKKTKVIGVGLSFDYLKLHTLLLDDAEKWEVALNLSIKNKINLIAEVGIATLMPEDAFKNADYTVDGNYGRFGLDYILQINADNHFMVGLRYSLSNYNESILYTSANPIFEDQIGNIQRSNLSANWLEFVVTSEKRINRIFKSPINDFLRLGFKVRLKSNLNYSKFKFANTQLLPGYGLTNTKLNPEINLYIKIRLGLISKS
jgi:hypothetical protein